MELDIPIEVHYHVHTQFDHGPQIIEKNDLFIFTPTDPFQESEILVFFPTLRDSIHLAIVAIMMRVITYMTRAINHVVKGIIIKIFEILE